MLSTRHNFIPAVKAFTFSAKSLKFTTEAMGAMGMEWPMEDFNKLGSYMTNLVI